MLEIYICVLFHVKYMLENWLVTDFWAKFFSHFVNFSIYWSLGQNFSNTL